MKLTAAIIATFAGICLAAVAGCGSEAPPQGQAEVNVAVSIPPQAYFVERVAGDLAEVVVLLPPGSSLATYEPTPGKMAALDRADVYFRIGVPFEDPLIEKARDTLDNLRIVDTRKGIELRPMGDEDGEHAHAGRGDPHIWLDPLLVKRQAETIADALCLIDPHHAEQYRANLAAFQADLDELHRDIARTLAPFEGSEILVFHPAYGYFAGRYGLSQRAVQVEGKSPSPRQLAEVIESARSTGARVIFVQPQFSRKEAEKVAEAIGGTVEAIDPLAANYAENLRAMADAVKRGLGGASAPTQPGQGGGAT